MRGGHPRRESAEVDDDDGSRRGRTAGAPDLVDRDFTASGPDQLRVADITYIRPWAGFLYVAVVLDVWSRRIVGWAMATHLRTELVLDAFDMALSQRRPEAVNELLISTQTGGVATTG